MNSLSSRGITLMSASKLVRAVEESRNTTYSLLQLVCADLIFMLHSMRYFETLAPPDWFKFIDFSALLPGMFKEALVVAIITPIALMAMWIAFSMFREPPKLSFHLLQLAIPFLPAFAILAWGLQLGVVAGDTSHIIGAADFQTAPQWQYAIYQKLITSAFIPPVIALIPAIFAPTFKSQRLPALSILIVGTVMLIALESDHLTQL